MAAVREGRPHLGDLFLQDLDDAGEVVVLRVLQDLQHKVRALLKVPVQDLHRDLEEELIRIVPMGIGDKRCIRIDAAGADRHLLVQQRVAVVLRVQGAEHGAQDRDVGEEPRGDLREIKLEVHVVDAGGKDRVCNDTGALLRELFQCLSVHAVHRIFGKERLFAEVLPGEHRDAV